MTPSPTNNFDRVDEIQRFLRMLLSVTPGAGFIKFHQLFQRSMVMGGGRGKGALRLRLLFCKIVCSLKHCKKSKDFAHFLRGGGGVTVILNLVFRRVG